MQSIAAAPSRGHLRSLVVGTVVGASLTAAGLGLAFLVIDTPLVSRLVPASRTGTSPMATAVIVWILSIVAGGALFVAGTNRLATTVAAVRSRSRRLPPTVRALASLPADAVVVTGIAPHGGQPIPQLVIGPFGVVVIHEMPGRDRIRRVEQAWEARTTDGWAPTEHPLDRVARDAERVRHWLTHGDLDFVVRVHAALVAPDASMPRSPLCAVISADQIPAWIAALPRQRSLSEGRRNVLLARLREAHVGEGPRRDW